MFPDIKPGGCETAPPAGQNMKGWFSGLKVLKGTVATFRRTSRLN